MKLKERIKTAYRVLTNKASKDMAMQQLIDFLGLNDTKEKALSEATYFACLKVLSESVGKLPLKLQYRLMFLFLFVQQVLDIFQSP